MRIEYAVLLVLAGVLSMKVIHNESHLKHVEACATLPSPHPDCR